MTDADCAFISAPVPALVLTQVSSPALLDLPKVTWVLYDLPTACFKRTHGGVVVGVRKIQSPK